MLIFFHVISMRNFSTGAKYFLQCQKNLNLCKKLKKPLLFNKNQINIVIRAFYNRFLKFSGKFRHFQANFGYFLACFGYFLTENHVKIVTSLLFLFKISHVNFFPCYFNEKFFNWR